MTKHLLLIISILSLSIVMQAQWTTSDVSLPRSNMGTASANGKIVYVGGAVGNSVSNQELFKKRVDIYDIASDAWTTEQLTVLRQFTFAVSVGNKIYFAGYTQTLVDDQDKVEVYDTDNGAWSTLTLPNIDGATSMCVAEEKIYFVNDGQVDIYDTSSNGWSSATLSNNRILAYAVSCNGKVLFIGGGFAAGVLEDVVDIYDINSNTWSVAAMSEGKNLVKAACLNNKIYIAGGQNGFFDYTNVIEIYDTQNDTWATSTMLSTKRDFGMTATADNIYLGGGYDDDAGETISVVEIINGTTGEVTSANLSTARSQVSAIAVGTKVYFAGGFQGDISDRVTTVDIYTEGGSVTTNNIQEQNFKLSPNPVSDFIYLTSPDGFDKTVEYQVYNQLGVLMLSGTYDGGIDLGSLPTGVYYFQFQGGVNGWENVVRE